MAAPPHSARKHRRASPGPAHCRRSPSSSTADAVIFLAVLLACGYLAMPCLQFFHRGLAAAIAASGCDLWVPPAVLGCAVAVLAAKLAIARRVVEGRKCENPGCLGLRDAPEFDVKIETEEMCAGGDAVDGGFFQLSGDHNRELEAKLKQVAPVNGRAVLVFRAKCGCSAGRMVVWGAKKGKKIRK